ncbi:calcium-binding protein [Geminocystis sp. NIES-3709]|uniref:beta strand repeat-containing protein n=1 Tax=Geminocystis sp. NIES-3709 TaxID=1617448 RepID=UPI0005FCABB0|nr:calcium-binding protein [Geminocystis sp. NIES-3709]BAQ63586.1 alkaline phosphatase [Geminocystis sp. NIES-3709]
MTTLNGTGLADSLNGSSLSPLTINGLAGDDTLLGGLQGDTLDGGDDNDSIIASRGNDSIIGGSGDDTINYANIGTAVTLQATGLLSKGSFGTDTLVGVETIIGATNRANVIDASSSTSAVLVDLANDTLTVVDFDGMGGDLNFQIINFVNVTGGSNDDTIIGNLSNNVLNGSAGNDSILGGLGNDTIDGGADNDSLLGGDGNDRILSGIGDDTILGGMGNDTIVLVAGDKLVYGGNDTTFDQGTDTADYSQLNESITLQATGLVVKGAGGASGTDTLAGIDNIIGDTGTGIVNTIDVSNEDLGGGAIDVDLGTNTLDVVNVDFGSGVIPLVSFGVTNFINVVGSNGSDTITGSSLANNLQGGDADDTINGGSGNDTILGDAGSDTLNGGLGNDSVVGGDGDDTLIGSRGNDRLIGGDDMMTTDTADYSDLGQRVTLRPQGVVAKDGGFGTDTLVGVETIIGTTGQSNLIDVSTSSLDINVDLGNDTLTVIDFDGMGTDLNFDVINFVNVTGGSGNDTIIGSAVANTLNGGVGDDSIQGGAENDNLNGGNGNDILEGGDDNDTIIGSSGSDSIFGGVDGTDSGTDTANYSALTQAITLQPLGVVAKGTLGTDTLSGIETIIGATNRANVIDVSTASAGLSIEVDLSNTSTDNLTVADSGMTFMGSFAVRNFRNVIGTDGNDTITGDSSTNLLDGGDGDDTLNGGTGNDTLVGSSGNDSLLGGTGTDTANYSSLGEIVTLGATGTITKETLGTDTLSGVEVIIGATGENNAIDASTATSGVSITVNLATTTNNLTIAGVPFATLPNPIFSVRNFVNVTGTNSVDNITGSTVDNTLSGLDGNDFIDGGSGNDSLDGGIDGDTLIGGIGNDTLIGNNGADSLVGGTGNDTLTGDSGNDTLIGSAGKDTLTGGGGSNVLDYRTLSDSLLSNFDIITDFSDTDDDFRVSSFGGFNNGTFNVASLTASAIASGLSGISFGAFQAATFTLTTDVGSSYLVINNSTAGYSSSTDAIVRLEGFAGTLTNANFV